MSIKPRRQRIFLHWENRNFIKEKDMYFSIEYRDKENNTYCDILSYKEINEPPKDIFIMKVKPLFQNKNYKAITGVRAWNFIRNISRWNDETERNEKHRQNEK